MYKSKIKILLFILLIALNYACNSTKNISGSYRSNFAEYGFFVIKLTLKPDSTFGYRMRGDVLSDTARGRYSVIHKAIIMRYGKPALEAGGYVMSGLNDSVLFQAEIVGDRGPKMYRVGYRKLFIVDSLGQKKTRTNGYSKHKKFLFWGNYYLLTRRYFLKKIS